MKRPFIPLVSAAVVVGCHGDVVSPLSGDGPHLSSVAAQCQPIQYQTVAQFGPSGFGITLSGDLVGTVVTVFPQPPTIHGVASLNDGVQFYAVSGGVFPSLIGTILENHNRSVAVFPPSLDGNGRINGHGALVGEGVGGRVNFHGTWDFNPFSIKLSYRGNICFE